MDFGEYKKFDAVGLADLLRRGEVSRQEILETAIRAAETTHPILNAIVTSDYERARTRGPRPGFFAGVPSFVKDNDALEGLPVRMGSFATRETPAARNSGFVESFLDLGFIPLGKSSLPEFGLTLTTEPLLSGPTHNPWDLSRSPGGSSGGAAALVASGVVPLAHGNDGGGSVRIPAAWCGLVGLKVSRGRLPGVDVKVPVDMIVQGVLTRTMRDTARFVVDASESFSSGDLPPIGPVERQPTAALRVGFFSRGPDGHSCDPETAAAVERTAATLADLGHQVEEIANPFPVWLMEDFFVVWALMPFGIRLLGSWLIPGVDRSRLDPLSRGMARFFARRILGAPGAVRRLRAWPAGYRACLEPYDVLVGPVTGSPAIELGRAAPDRPFEEQREQILPLANYTPVLNAAGAPGLSIPAGRTAAGLPIGVQLAAGVGRERLLLDLGYALEEAAPWRVEPADLGVG